MKSQNSHVQKRDISSITTVLHLEVSNGCNIHCPMCTFHDNTKKISWMTYDQISRIDRGLENIRAIHIGDGSEPLINPELPKIIRHFSSRGVMVNIQTNAKLIQNITDAQRLVRSGLHRLAISVDGVTDKVVSRIRKGTSFTAIANSIRLINQAKAELQSESPQLVANAVAMRSNLHELPELAEFLIKNGFFRMRIGFLELREPNRDLVKELLIYDKPGTMRMVKKVRECIAGHTNKMHFNADLFDSGVSQDRRSSCTAYRDRLYVRFNGDMYACYGKKRIGNLYDDGVEGCMRSDEYQQYITQVTQTNNEICKMCTFCEVMAIDALQDHFGRSSIQYYSREVIENSLEWVAGGGNVDDYWGAYYSRQTFA